MAQDQDQQKESVQGDGPASEPVTVKDRLVGLGMVLAMFLIGGGMFIRPVLLPTDEISDVSRHRTRGVVYIVEMVWSRPVGIALVVLGALLCFAIVKGAIAKKMFNPENST